MADRPRIVLTHRVFDDTLALLAPHGEIVANQSGKTLVRTDILARLADADAVMTFMPDLVDTAFLDAGPRLRIVAGALKGYDNFDIPACTARGIWATIVPDLLTVPTAELAIGMAIALGRHVRAGDRRVRTGAFAGWLPDLYGTGLAGSTVGIVGMGRIGRALARRLAGFDTRLLYTETERLPAAEEDLLGLGFTSLGELLTESDIVFLGVPLGDGTRHLIDAHTLSLMKPAALLINPCRGSVVDENAVAEALENDALGGYAADVFEFEDWALPDRPRDVPARLRALDDRVLFTPHLGSAVTEVRRAIERSAADSILAVLRGEEPPGAVNAPHPRPINAAAGR